MRIMPISIQQNSQPNFNGYLDKSVTKLINKRANLRIKRELKRANETGRAVNQEVLTDIRGKADKCIETLQKAVENLHPDTYISINYPHRWGSDFVTLSLNNSKIKKGCDLWYENYHLLKSKHKGSPMPDINMLYKIVDNLKENLEDPKIMKKAENYLFEQFAEKSFVISEMRRAKKADKLAPEFGFTPHYVETLKKEKAKKKAATKAGLNVIIEKEKALRAAQKNVRKSNIETVEKYLK